MNAVEELNAQHQVDILSSWDKEQLIDEILNKQDEILNKQDEILNKQDEIFALEELNTRLRWKSNSRKRALRDLNRAMLAKNAELKNERSHV